MKFKKQLDISSSQFLFTLSVVFYICSISTIAEGGNSSVSAIYTFGDSILDTGTNNFLATSSRCNFPPYGKNFPGGVATGRWCNGKVPSDLIAEALGVKDTVPASDDPGLQDQDLLTGVGFASGGSGLDPRTAAVQSIPSIEAQLDEFKQYVVRLKGVVGEDSANQIISNSLALVSAGNNDFQFSLPGQSFPFNNLFTYTDQMAVWASQLTKGLYDTGVRRIAFFSTLPLGCLPWGRTLGGQMGGGCNVFANYAAQLFNDKLKSALGNLNSTLPGAKFVYIDIYSALDNMSQNPLNYGFEVVDKGCCMTVGPVCNFMNPITCPDPTKYIFWDNLHPTEAAYKAVVSQILPTIQSVV